MQSYHFIFRHSESTSLATWYRFLRVVFTLLQVHGKNIQLDHHCAAIQLIVTPNVTIKVITLYTELVCKPNRQPTKQVFEYPRNRFELWYSDAPPVYRAGLLPVKPLMDAVSTEGMLTPAME